MKTTRRTSLRNRRSAKLWLNSLEQRVVPATFTVNDSNDSSSGTGTSGTLRYCLGLANSTAGADTIIFDGTPTINLTSAAGGTLVVDDEVRFQGQFDVFNLADLSGNAIIDAGNEFRPFLLNKSATFDHVYIRNGYSEANGGGILVNADRVVHLFYSRVSGCNADFNGGAVAVPMGRIYTDGSVFDGNSAGDNGGAIYCNGLVTMIDTYIAYNTAGADGGGVCAESDWFDMLHCDVTSNQAKRGGGIALGGIPSAAITDAAITHNSATAGGGGIASSVLGTITVTKGSISANTAEGRGGGIYHTAGDLLLIGGDRYTVPCNISGNSAGLDGGGVSAVGGTVYALYTTLSENRVASGKSGGGVHSVVPLTLVSSDLYRNAASYGGGANVEGQSASLVATDVTFCEQNYQGIPAINGGGIRLYDVSTTNKSMITDCSTQVTLPTASSPIKSGNYADNGGGIFIAVGGAIEISGCDLTHNFTSKQGGSVFITTFGGENSSVTISNGTMAGKLDVAEFGAGVSIFKLSAPVTIDGCLFTDAGVTHYGGGLFITGEPTVAGKLTVSNSKFEKCSANAGGGIAIIQTNADCLITKCSITSNTASNMALPFGINGGAGIAIVQSPTVLVESSFVAANTSTFGGEYGGGGILCSYLLPRIPTSIVQPLRIVNCTIYGNTASRGGGILFDRSGTDTELQVFNCTIAYNSAVLQLPHAGGGIACSDDTITGGGLLRLDSTIVAQNSVLDQSTGPDIGGSAGIVLANYCVIQQATSGFVLASASSDNQLGADPGFSPLGPQSNGGPTKTIALLGTSAALNSGRNALGLATDQRGVPFGRSRSSRTDVGAYESQSGLAAKLTELRINEGYLGYGGESQRSQVWYIGLHFDSNVEFPTTPQLTTDYGAAIRLARQSDSLVPAAHFSVVQANPTILKIDFLMGTTLPNSLPDGRYDFAILAGQLPAEFDGDGNGIAGDNYVLNSAPYVPGNWVPPTNIYRFWGDANSNGQIDSADFLQFRIHFLSSDPTFDFDADGDVDTDDFFAFRLRFLQYSP